ncbi:MAG: CDP-2,3-bis-(O-geranylgeranyl)-sn-glycerol synthase [Halobacteriaceae archaeon]
MDPRAVVVTALWAMLPAYVPNNAAVLFGGGPPIDGGRTWRGKRLLGDGKTWRGTVAGVAVGAALALALSAVAPDVGAAVGVDVPRFPLPVALSLAGGALLGDVLGSFLKRRIGRERGAAVPLVDQLDLVVGSLLLTALVAPAWFGRVFTPAVIVVVVVVTPVLHLATNAIAYALGLKDEPW